MVLVAEVTMHRLAGRKGESNCGVGFSWWNFRVCSFVSDIDCSRLNGGGGLIGGVSFCIPPLSPT